jgi:hypothetical protein
MKRFYKWGILGGIAVLLFVAVVFLTPPMMKAPRKDFAYYRQIAKQELFDLKTGIEDYKDKYGLMPSSLNELRLKTDYLRGVTPTWRSNIFRRIEFPYKEDKVVAGSQVIARYLAGEKFRFILLQDGQILAEDPKMEQKSDKSTNGINP